MSSSGVIGPDHPLVLSGAIKLTRVGDNQPDEESSVEQQQQQQEFPSEWGERPNHPPTHEGRTDPEETSSAAESDADFFARSGAAPLSKSISMDNDVLVQKARARNNRAAQRKSKRADASSSDVFQSTVSPPASSGREKRTFSSMSSKWKASKSVIDASAYMLSEQLKRSQSDPGDLGGKSSSGKNKKKKNKKNKKKKKKKKNKEEEEEKEDEEEEERNRREKMSNVNLSDMAPCPSPSHLRGVPRKTGMIAPRNVWNPSPHSQHVQEHGLESTTLAQQLIIEQAKTRHAKNERREKRQFAKNKRIAKEEQKKLELEQAIVLVYRYKIQVTEDDKGNEVETIIASVLKESEITEEDRAMQDDDTVLSMKKLTLGKKVNKLELEERVSARQEALREHEEEQERLLELARKETERKWRQNWKDMHETRLDTSVPGRPNFDQKMRTAQEESEESEEDRKKKKKQQRDKVIMRQQRLRIRAREASVLAAQAQLQRIHKQHELWVKSELKKDAVLASGKHLGPEEMLFVVQARNSESVHPTYTNHVSDVTSRNVVPVQRLHPSYYGYERRRRKQHWEAEAQIEEISIEKAKERVNQRKVLAEKKNAKAALKRAKDDAANGSRKERREYAKAQEVQKKIKMEEKKKKNEEEKKKKKSEKEEMEGGGLYTPGERKELVIMKGKTSMNWQVVHPSCCGKVGGGKLMRVLDGEEEKKIKKGIDTMTLFIIWNRIKDGKLKGTSLCDHPSSIHKVTMEETLAISKYTSATNKAAKIVEELRQIRHTRFVKKYTKQDDQSHPSWVETWKTHTITKTICDVNKSHPALFQRAFVPLNQVVPPEEIPDVYKPPLRWERPARCVVCQAPPGVLGRPGCPGCFDSKARLPWTTPKRSLPEIYPPPFERDHGVVRLKKLRKRTKEEKEQRRRAKVTKLAKTKYEMESQSAIIDQASLSPLKSTLDLNEKRQKTRQEEKNLDLATQAGLLRAAKLANYHTPMIDRKAVLQHRRNGGIQYITVWLKTIPGGTCVRLVLDKHETIERLRFLFLTNSGEYGPESWGYMMLPTDNGCYFLDSRIRYQTELALEYRPGDRDLTNYGVGEPGGGNEVVILMVSAGGGRTELNIRTMSEMLRRYFFQNANVEHNNDGEPMYLPTNIIERIMKGRWGSEGAPTSFPGNDNAQKQLIRMCKNQLRIKQAAWEDDMEIIRTAEKRNRAEAYRRHLKKSLDTKMKSYRMLQSTLTKEKKDLVALDHQEMLDMIDSMKDNDLNNVTTSDILRRGKRSAKKRRLENRLKMVQQKEKRFVASTKARTLSNHEDIPMYVFRKWKPPPVPPPPPPPPPRRPGILTRFAMGTYKYLLKPIYSGTVGTVRRVQALRQAIKEAQEAEEFESDSDDDEEEKNDGEESDDELKGVDEPVDVFAMQDDEGED